VSVLVPETSYPRLIRYVEHNTLDGAVATLDRESNVLRIDRKMFKQLSPSRQEQIIRTSQEWIEAPPLVPAQYGN
jgi:hypothetical protein